MSMLPTMQPPCWNYQEGLLELIDKGSSFSEIEQKLHDGSLALAQQTRAGLSTTKLESLIKWLQGFRKDTVLYEEEKVYLPFIELWAPPGGKAQFAYEVSSESGSATEISFFGFTGFGGGSKRKITESIKMGSDGGGRSFNLGFLLTVTRYTHKSDKTKSFEKIDVKGAPGDFDFKLNDLAAGSFGLKNQEIKESHLFPEEYSHKSFLRLSDSKTEGLDTYSPSTEESSDWSFQLTLPLLKNKVKLGVSAKNSKALKASFDCPRGYDYVFFSSFGENRAVPYCARLIK